MPHDARRVALVIAAALLAACSSPASTPSAGDTTAVADAGDMPPRLLDAELPVRYPSEIYRRGVGGRVMLRLFIDSLGAVVADSTRIETSSGVPELDSAAVRGVPDMHFAPASRRGAAVAVPVLVPVDFPRADTSSAAPAIQAATPGTPRD